MVIALALLLQSASAAEAYGRGVTLIEQGRPAEAVEHLRVAVGAAPQDPQYQKALGVSLAMQKLYAEADAPFARACAIKPSLVDACYFYGRNLYALDRYDDALAALRKALPVDSRPWRVWLGIAQAEHALGRAAEAEKDYRQAIRLHTQSSSSDDPRVHFGSFLFREGRLEEAATILAELCVKRPDSARGHLELGRVLMQTGNLDEAATHLTRAAELGAGDQARMLLEKIKARRAMDNQ